MVLLEDDNAISSLSELTSDTNGRANCGARNPPIPYPRCIIYTGGPEDVPQRWSTSVFTPSLKTISVTYNYLLWW